jgi:DNA-binding transcriptional regulator YhcF (GntR family)
MILRKYTDFVDSAINENVQNAKIWLKKRALADKKTKMSRGGEEDKNITLSPEEVRAIENDKSFLKIKELLERSPGWVLTFTKFFFNEGVPFEDLEIMYKKLKDYRSELSSLPMTVEKYADIVPSNSDLRKGFERLGDDIEKLRLNRITKKFVERLPGDFVVTNPNAKDKGVNVPSIKRAYADLSSETIKQKVADIAKAFEEFGKDPDGTINAKKNKELQDLFFEKIRRYRNLNEVIQGALSYIKSANNAQISKFLQAMKKVNEKYGELNGVEVVYDNNNILIVEIRSYFANKDLNANTSHCIKDSPSQWDNYVGADNNFNKQYYIYNFNLSPADNKSVIGITIKPKYEIRACHLKNDENFASSIKQYMKSLGIPFEILEPMTKEEIEIKKKRVIANKEVVQEGISLKSLIKCYENGADPNAQQGKPLINAVKENDFERTKWLLEHGAMPNMGSAIKSAQNLDMIKLLVSYGATLTNEIFAKAANDYGAVKFLIDAGMDVNFEQSLPLRKAVALNNLEIVKLLLDNGADVAARRFMAIKTSIDCNSSEEILKLLCQSLVDRKVPVSKSTVAEFFGWTQSSIKFDESRRKVLEDFAEKVGLTKKEISTIIKEKTK